MRACQQNPACQPQRKTRQDNQKGGKGAGCRHLVCTEKNSGPRAIWRPELLLFLQLRTPGGAANSSGQGQGQGLKEFFGQGTFHSLKLKGKDQAQELISQLCRDAR